MAASTMPSPGQSMFTIEQFELIRRLRNSGVSKEQILQSFDSLERLDRELGAIYNVPISMSAGFPALAALQGSMTAGASAAAANVAAVMAMGARAQMQAQVQAAHQAASRGSHPDTPSRKRPAEGAPEGSSAPRSNGDIPAPELSNSINNGLTAASMNGVPSSMSSSSMNGHHGSYLDDDVEHSEEFKEMASYVLSLSRALGN